MVAHRLETIRNASDILVMAGGRLVEQGAHDELLARGGAYARMWESQSSLAAYALADDGGDADAAMYAEQGEGAVAASVAGAAPASGDAAERGAGETPAPRRRSGLSVMARMMGLVRPIAGWLLLAVLLGSVGMLAAAAVPALGAVGLVAALEQDAGAPGVLAGACVVCAICGVVRGPLHYGEQLCNHYIAFRLLAHIRDLVFGALRRLAPARLEGRGKGELVSLVTSDIELLEVFYAHTISPIAICIVCVAVVLALLGGVAPELSLVALASYAVLGVLVPLAASRACGGAGRASREAVGRMGAYVLEGLRGVSETIQYDGCAARQASLDVLTDEMGAIDARLQRRQAATEAVADALVLLASLAMLGASLALAAAGRIDLAHAFVATFAFFSSFGPVMAVSRLGASLQATLASGARVLDLLDEEPQCPEVKDGVDVAFDGAVLERVGFTYGGAPVLAGIDCAFPAGSMTCVSGRSGSGKSTLLKLLMRFWDATEGVVSVSGVDVRRVNTASLRAAEAYMTQETHLFVGTLGDNLRVARADATTDELDAACEAASLATLVRRLPAGYDTPVAELGDSLSGGERQRIGLARVFLSDADFVLLDEPTSALDALNEAAVMRSVAALRAAGKTVVLVSHRASTCSFADRMVSVEDGRLS